MANSIFLKRLNFTPSNLIHPHYNSSSKIAANFESNPLKNLIIRPFSSSPNLNSEPNSEPTQSKPVDSQTILSTVSNKPISDEPKTPKNLLVDFYKTRTSGYVTHAAKAFDKMSKRLRPFQNNRSFTHEKMEMYKGGGHGRMPDVVAHIAVLEAYANAGQTNKSAQKVYLKMLGPGVIPNEYTYNLLIKLLASSRDWTMIGQSQKYLLEMLEKGIMPSAETSVAVLKALAREGKEREAKEFLQDIKARGFVVDKNVFKEVVKGNGGPIKVLRSKRGRIVRTLLEIIFAKKGLSV